MTDSVEAPERSGRRQDKRERLIAAACQMIYAAGRGEDHARRHRGRGRHPARQRLLLLQDQGRPSFRPWSRRTCTRPAPCSPRSRPPTPTPRERLKALFGALAEQSDLIARLRLPARFAVPGTGQARRRRRPGRRADARAPSTGRNASSRPWAAPTRATSRSRSSPGTRAPRCCQHVPRPWPDGRRGPPGRPSGSTPSTERVAVTEPLNGPVRDKYSARATGEPRLPETRNTNVTSRRISLRSGDKSTESLEKPHLPVRKSHL